MTTLIERLEKENGCEGLYKIIIETLTNCGAVLPLTVWTPTFRQRNARGEWGEPFNRQPEKATSYEDAALLYLSVDSGSPDETKIDVPKQIVDSTGTIVFVKK